MHAQHVQRRLADRVTSALSLLAIGRPLDRPQSRAHVLDPDILAEHALLEQELDHLGRTNDVGLDGVQEIIGRELQRRVLGREVDAGVVDDVVDLGVAESGAGRLGKLADGGQVGGVAFKNVSLVVGEGLESRVVLGEVADESEDGVVWGLGELADKLEADAAVGAGDDVGRHFGFVCGSGLVAVAGERDGGGETASKEDWTFLYLSLLASL